MDSLEYHGPLRYYEQRIRLRNRYDDLLSDDLILDGPVDFTNSEFVNNLSFAAATFKKPLSFHSVYFDSIANFSQVDFDSADFMNTKFIREADFTASTFHGATTFQFAVFRQDASFDEQPPWAHSDQTVNLVFSQNSDFSRDSFYRRAGFFGVISSGQFSFDETVCEGETDFSSSSFCTASFGHTEFRGAVDFSQTRFNGCAFFDGARFDSSLNLSNAIFQTPEGFAEAYFGDLADFTQTRFDHKLDLFSLKLGDKSIFRFFNCRLPDLIDLSNNPRVPSEMVLTDADFSNARQYADSLRRWHYINLFKTDIPHVHIDYQHFRLCFFDPLRTDSTLSNFSSRATLTLEGVEYGVRDSFMVQRLLESRYVRNYLKQVFPSAELTDTVIQVFLESCIQDRRFPASLPEDEVISTYEKVLKTFDQEGQKVSYRALDIEYQDYRAGWFRVGKWWNQYGYRKAEVFWWSGLLLIVYTVVSFFFLDKLNRPAQKGGIYYIRGIPDQFPIKSLLCILTRAWFALLYTSVIFFLFGLSISNLNFKKAGMLYIILVYTSGLLCISYMAAFVLQR